MVRNLLVTLETGVWSLAWEDPLAWQPPPVFWPRDFHGQRSLAGYSSWGHKESYTTEWLTQAKEKKEVTVNKEYFVKPPFILRMVKKLEACNVSNRELRTLRMNMLETVGRMLKVTRIKDSSFSPSKEFLTCSWITKNSHDTRHWTPWKPC